MPRNYPRRGDPEPERSVPASDVTLCKAAGMLVFHPHSAAALEWCVGLIPQRDWIGASFWQRSSEGIALLELMRADGLTVNE